MEKLRCFVAIELPDELKSSLAALTPKIQGLKQVEPQNLHITLKFLSEITYAQAAEIEKSLRTVSFSPFDITLIGVGVFPSVSYARVLWAGCQSAELESLAMKINKATEQYGKNEKFTSHITISRVRKRTDLLPFLSKYKNHDFGSFHCNSFELKQSILSMAAAPEYRTLVIFESNETK